MSESMERLESLVETATLRAMQRRTPNGRVFWQVGDSDCPYTTLFYDGDGAGVLAEMTAGSTFTVHDHGESVEHIVVLKGRIRVESDGRVIGEATRGGHLAIPPHTSHVCIVLEDARMVGVTVPADPGYAHPEVESPDDRLPPD